MGHQVALSRKRTRLAHMRTLLRGVCANVRPVPPSANTTNILKCACALENVRHNLLPQRPVTAATIAVPWDCSVDFHGCSCNGKAATAGPFQPVPAEHIGKMPAAADRAHAIALSMPLKCCLSTWQRP